MFRPGRGRPRPRPLLSGSAARDNQNSLASVNPAVPRVTPSAIPVPNQASAPGSDSRSLPSRRTGVQLKSVNKARYQRGNPGSKPESEEVTEYFAVLYTKRSRKKRKSYSDGFLILRNDKVVSLMSDVGKLLAKSSSGSRLGGLKSGNTLEVGTFEVEVDRSMASEDFTSGRAFLPLQSLGNVSKAGSSSRTPLPLASKSNFARFKAPRDKNGSLPKSGVVVRKPLHDPGALFSCVLQESFTDSSGNMTVPIVVDPHLSRHLRPHQRDGVRFLYECVEGRLKKREDNRGAILADEMGLGKTLQCIALLWTLLKQGPLGAPAVQKAIIVCPASLVGNWLAEIKKWLGDERLSPISIQSGSSKSFNGLLPVNDFIRGKVKRVLVLSYEMFRNLSSELHGDCCGLIICDEGHRLKAAHGNKTIDSLMSIPCRRRIIVTGTPVQNDLDEFFAMCNFVNPGSLGDLGTFRSVFASPIVASRDSGASKEIKELGCSRANELRRLSSEFVLRRNSNTLAKYLPPKTETVVFCRLSNHQAGLYGEVCREGFTGIGLSNMGMAFSTITKLRKICNHPGLLQQVSDEDEPNHSCNVETAVTSRKFDMLLSSKLEMAVSITREAINVGDRVVLVSNFTTALDVLQASFEDIGLKFFRLDGSTPSKVRVELVARFNAGRTGETVFLLSAKAGGVGLNLIGANRLICFDPDWNPATDMQAMARVWRDGQQKRVYIYRLLCTGTIEEKIYQRQLFKGELQTALQGSTGVRNERSKSRAMRGTEKSGCNFSPDELRNIFTYSENVELCETLTVLENSRESAQDIGFCEDSHTADEKDSLHYRFDQCRRSLGEDLTGERRNVSECPALLEDDGVLKRVVKAASASGLHVTYLFVDNTHNPGGSRQTLETSPTRSASGRASRAKSTSVTGDAVTPDSGIPLVQPPAKRMKIVDSDSDSSQSPDEVLHEEKSSADEKLSWDSIADILTTGDGL